VTSSASSQPSTSEMDPEGLAFSLRDQASEHAAKSRLFLHSLPSTSAVGIATVTLAHLKCVLVVCMAWSGLEVCLGRRVQLSTRFKLFARCEPSCHARKVHVVLRRDGTWCDISNFCRKEVKQKSVIHFFLKI